MFEKSKKCFFKTKNKEKSDQTKDTFYPKKELGKISKVAKEISELNNVTCYSTVWKNGKPIIVIEIQQGEFIPEKALYPEGYYYSKKNGLINKRNIENGIYSCYEILLVTQQFGKGIIRCKWL